MEIGVYEWTTRREVGIKQQILGAEFWAEVAIGRNVGYNTVLINARGNTSRNTDTTVWQAPQDAHVAYDELPLTLLGDVPADWDTPIIVRGQSLGGRERQEVVTVNGGLDSDWRSVFNMGWLGPNPNLGDIWVEYPNGSFEDYMTAGDSFSFSGHRRIPNRQIGLLPELNVVMSAPQRTQVWLSAGFAGTAPKRFMRLRDGQNRMRVPLRLSPDVVISLISRSTRNNDTVDVSGQIVLIDPKNVPVGQPLGGLEAPQ